jgi:hypothetical protein
LFFLINIIFLSFAFIVDIEVVPVKSGEGGHRTEHARPAEQGLEAGVTEQSGSQRAEEHREAEPGKTEHGDRSVEIYGSMTLYQIERHYKVPADSIKKFLGVPLSVSDRENLGRLRRHYGFHMSDVERFIERY